MRHGKIIEFTHDEPCSIPEITIIKIGENKPMEVPIPVSIPQLEPAEPKKESNYVS